MIGNIKPQNNLFLSPMAGICDVAFRVLCKKYGAGIVYSEFINVEGITREIEATMKRITTVDEERPVGIQIFGTNLDSIAKSCRILSDKCELIDFNIGCPVHKVTCTGAGGALLKNPEKLGEIIRTMKQNSSVPVTVKMRRVENYDETIKLAKVIEQNGADAIAIHGRTVEQGYTGKADWSYIKAVKENLSIPVIGNGDVNSREDYLKILKETKCDAVLVGRTAMKNPGIFSEILFDKKIDKVKMFFEYYELAEKFGINDISKIKLMAQNMTKGLDGSAKLRESMNTVKDVNGILEIMDHFREKIVIGV